jgi:hypothetical protein
MCSCDDFYISIIDACGGKRSEFSEAATVLLRPALAFSDAARAENHERAKEFSDRETSPRMLEVEKNSSGTLAGDFGARVVCARQHHFFLDITFY